MTKPLFSFAFVVLSVIRLAGADDELREVPKLKSPQPTKTRERDSKQVELRLVGGDKTTPLSGVSIELIGSAEQDHKKFGPFKTDDVGMATVRVPVGFYSLNLK